MVQNIQLMPTLLSRFDLIYLVLDQPNEQRDRRLAKHIVALYYPVRTFGFVSAFAPALFAICPYEFLAVCFPPCLPSCTLHARLCPLACSFRLLCWPARSACSAALHPAVRLVWLLSCARLTLRSLQCLNRR